MEQNHLIVAKKFWKIVRVMYHMLRKGISKVKLLADLHIMMNRAKIAGKLSSIHNLMFHHHAASTAENHLSDPVPLNEYEYSCTNSPANNYTNFHLPFNLIKRKHRHAPSEDEMFMAALEMAASSAAASPALPGFGQTPIVSQPRITDSPFPLRGADVDSHVDEAAEEFIKKFHRDLREQNDVA